MRFVIKDIHAHLPSASIESIVSIRVGKDAFPDSRPCSVGLHPWDAGPGYMPLVDEVEAFALRDNVLAVGEAGIDRLCGVDLRLQAEAFERQAMIAESLSLPLLIHNVRSSSDLIAIKLRLRPASQWIIHGFRGHPRLAGQLLEHGFLLSFGERFNAETVAMTPTGMMFCETDGCSSGIDAVRLMLSRAKGMDLDEFNALIDRNIASVFGRGR